MDSLIQLCRQWVGPLPCICILVALKRALALFSNISSTRSRSNVKIWWLWKEPFIEMNTTIRIQRIANSYLLFIINVRLQRYAKHCTIMQIEYQSNALFYRSSPWPGWGPGGHLYLKLDITLVKKFTQLGLFFSTRQCTRVHRLGVQKRAKLEKKVCFGA